MKGKIHSIFIVFFIFFNLNLFAEEKFIASFNSLRLGKNEKNLTLVANTLKNFSLIGLTEVMTKEGIEELVDSLEKNSSLDWEYHISPYSVGHSSYKEFFAFIWKKNDVTFIRELGFYPDENKIFSRPPYGAYFRINDFDFYFVMAHSIFGKSESLRRAEAFNLDEVYDYFQNLDSKENDVIIAGDFNLSALDESFNQLLKHDDQIIYAVDPLIKTTLGNKGFSNSYDNIFLSKLFTKEYTGKSGAYDFTENNFKKNKTSISDHLPVFIIINSQKDDD